jgi:hypothetical protein
MTEFRRDGKPSGFLSWFSGRGRRVVKDPGAGAVVGVNGGEHRVSGFVIAVLPKETDGLSESDQLDEATDGGSQIAESSPETLVLPDHILVALK